MDDALDKFNEKRRKKFKPYHILIVFVLFTATIVLIVFEIVNKDKNSTSKKSRPKLQFKSKTKHQKEAMDAELISMITKEMEEKESAIDDVRTNSSEDKVTEDSLIVDYLQFCDLNNMVPKDKYKMGCGVDKTEEAQSTG